MTNDSVHSPSGTLLPVQSVDIRDALALERTRLAAERTYAAWVRTGIAALASGAGAHSLLERVVSARLNKTISCVLILFAVFCFAAGIWRESQANSASRGPAAARIAPIVLCIASAALIVISLAVMLGVWRRQ